MCLSETGASIRVRLGEGKTTGLSSYLRRSIGFIVFSYVLLFHNSWYMDLLFYFIIYFFALFVSRTVNELIRPTKRWKLGLQMQTAAFGWKYFSDWDDRWMANASSHSFLISPIMSCGFTAARSLFLTLNILYFFIICVFSQISGRNRDSVIHGNKTVQTSPVSCDGCCVILCFGDASTGSDSSAKHFS